MTSENTRVMNNKQLISICIPTYNYGNYLPEALNSVISQTYDNIEILVVDDASNDNTEEVVLGFSKLDNRIRFIRHEKNIGMVNNWNFCLENARGELIKFLFADDYLVDNEAIEKLSSAFEDSNVVLATSSRFFVNNKSAVISSIVPDLFGKGVSGIDAIRMCILMQQNIIGEPSTVMFRKIDALRGFNNRYNQLVDLEMWFYLLMKGELFFCPEILCAFRVHDQQQTAKNRAKSITVLETDLLYENYLHVIKKPVSKLIIMYLKYDLDYQRNKNRSKFGGNSKNKYINNLAFYLLLPIYKIVKPVVKMGRKFYLMGNLS